MSSVFLLVRLAVATGLVLAPGAIAARAVGVRSTSATLAWGLGAVFAATAIVFVVHASLGLALVLLLVVALVAAPFAIRRPALPQLPGRGRVWTAGAVLGLLLWHVAGEIGGDGLFHLARIRNPGSRSSCGGIPAICGRWCVNCWPSASARLFLGLQVQPLARPKRSMAGC